MVDAGSLAVVTCFLAVSSLSFHFHTKPLHYRVPLRPDCINYQQVVRQPVPCDCCSKAAHLHRLGDTVEKNHHLADLLASRGFACHGMDYPGWGASQRESRMGSSYEPCLTKNWTKEICEEVIHFTKNVASRYPVGLKKFVIAPSLGGATALASCLMKPDLFDGAVLLCPAIKSDVKPVLQMLVPWLAFLFPRMGAAQVGDEDIGSRNLFIAESIQQDMTKSNQPLPVVTAAALVYLLQFLKENVQNMKVPFLVMHGKKDLVINPEGSELLHDKAAASDKSLKWYPEAWHDLLYEPEWQEVLSDILSWIEARAPPLKSAKSG